MLRVPRLDISRITAQPEKISEFPGTPPRATARSFTWEDAFEHIGSFPSFPSMPAAPEIYTSFNVGEAREICEDEDCLKIMQEIAAQNAQFLAKDGHSYAFKRFPHDLSLNEAFQALALEGTVQVSIGKNPCHESPRIVELASLSDLMRWWGNK